MHILKNNCMWDCICALDKNGNYDPEIFGIFKIIVCLLDLPTMERGV
jgi:hypothetical protein